MKDNTDTLREFLRQHTISYPALLGGTFDDPFARAYLVDSTPTNLVIAPDGTVMFVGRGSASLERAVRTIADAERGAPRPTR